jgi:thioredoxin reductase
MREEHSMNAKRWRTEVQYLIIGAGPAGLQLGYYLKNAKLDYLIIERDETPGAFFKRFPRHRKLISINKVYTGPSNPEVDLRWDWNSLLCDDPALLFKNFSRDYFPHADTMVDYLKAFAERYQLSVEYGFDVKVISKRNGKFHVHDKSGRLIEARYLIVATGRSAPYLPSFPGVEHCDRYWDVSTDPSEFIDKRVFIIGKGNSGFETADNLIATTSAIFLAGPNPMRLAWKTHYVGDVRAVNNNFLDTFQLKSQNTLLAAEVERVSREGSQLRVSIRHTRAEDQRRDILVDRIILCTGFRFDSSIFDESCRPELTLGERLPKLNGDWGSANVPDLYFAGTLMHALDYKEAYSGFIHGFRYNILSLMRIFAVTHFSHDWPSRPVSRDSRTLVGTIFDRLHNVSSLFQSPGFLTDLITLEGGAAALYEDVPRTYVPLNAYFAKSQRLQITLEFGTDKTQDPFSTIRYPFSKSGEQSTLIHPVIRFFDGSDLVSTHHVLQHLENQWGNERAKGLAANFIDDCFGVKQSVAS